MPGTVLNSQCINQARELTPSLNCHAAVLTSPSSSYPTITDCGEYLGCLWRMFFLYFISCTAASSPGRIQRTMDFMVTHRAFYTFLLWSFLPSYLSSCCSFQHHPHHCLLPQYTITFHPGHPFTPSLFEALDYPSWNLSGSHHHPTHI